MKDIVTYCPDLEALKTELVDLDSVDEEGNGNLPLTRTPIQYAANGSQSLALCRFMDDSKIVELAKLNNLEVLGTYEEIFSDSEKLAKYTNVYSIDPVTITDENGEEVVYQPPKKFGVFA